MAYHDELLLQAFQLVRKEPKQPRQASLRRGVSAGYYALFHLLIDDAVGNWSQVDFRPVLARSFDHSQMKGASNRIQNKQAYPFHGEDPNSVTAVRFVAETFARLQERRHIADYDNSKFWSRSEALLEVQLADDAFRAWKPVRREKVAQAYLVSLLAKKRE